MLVVCTWYTFMLAPWNVIVCLLNNGSSSRHSQLTDRRDLVQSPLLNSLTFEPLSLFYSYVSNIQFLELPSGVNRPLCIAKTYSELKALATLWSVRNALSLQDSSASPISNSQCSPSMFSSFLFISRQSSVVSAHINIMHLVMRVMVKLCLVCKHFVLSDINSCKK